MLANLIQKLENIKISFGTYLAIAFSIIIVRVGLESFSSNKAVLFSYSSFPHIFLFFISLFLNLFFLIYFLTRENIIKISKIGLLAMLILWIAPAFDLFLSRAKTPFSMGYIFDSPKNFLSRYFTFLFGSGEAGITYGMKLQIILACFIVAAYIFLKTKNYIKTLLAFILTYTIIFIYSFLPSIIAAVELKRLDFNFGEILEVLLLPKSIFQIKFSDPWPLFDYKMGLVLLFLIILQISLWYLIYSFKKFKAIILYSVRYLRFFLQILTLFVGLWLGWKLTENLWDFSIFGILTLFALFVIVFFIWLFSVVINDIYDLEIDKLSPANQNRILVQKIMDVEEYKNLGFVFLLLANLAAFILGPAFFTLSLILSALSSYIYSAPPLRFRKFPFLGHFVIGLAALCAVFLGFLIFAKNQDLSEFPPKFAILIPFFFMLATHIKDIKDLKADKTYGVITLPTLFGEQRGKLFCGILVFLSFLFFSLFLGNKLLILFSLGFGLIGFFLTYDKKSKEYIVFTLYFLYLLIVFLMSF
ncbi:MAG: UbiA family prenyltransferase [Patescibacteria group bacterium]